MKSPSERRGAAARTRSRRTRILTAAFDRATTALIVVVGLSFAEVASRSEWVSSLVMPAPSDVWSALVVGFQRGSYWPHFTSTLSAMAAGFAISAFIAILMAGLIVTIPRFERVILPLVVAFQTLPKIAVAPVVVLWLGFGQMGKITIVSLVSFFPILVNSIQGLRVRDRDQLHLMQSLGSSRWQLFRYNRIPNALPYIFAGLHVGIIFALLGAIVAEFVGSRRGLGFFLLQQKAAFDVPGVFAILVVLMVVGLALHGVMTLLERRVVFWSKDLANPVA